MIDHSQQEESYTVPEPVVSNSAGSRFVIEMGNYRLDLSRRQGIEAVLCGVVGFLVNWLLSWMTSGFWFYLHIVILVVVAMSAWVYIFQPIGGHRGTTWLILATLFRLNRTRHKAVSRVRERPKIQGWQVRAATTSSQPVSPIVVGEISPIEVQP